MIICKKCKQAPAYLDGVLCLACRQNKPKNVIKPYKHRPPKEAGYSNIWRNLTAKQIQALRKKQAGQCPICKRHGLYLVLDHNHKTDKARGYLCRGCNTKLSGFDNPTFAQRARAYLDNPPADNL